MSETESIEHLDWTATYKCAVAWGTLGRKDHKKTCDCTAEYIIAYEDLFHDRRVLTLTACEACLNDIAGRDLLVSAERL